MHKNRASSFDDSTFGFFCAEAGASQNQASSFNRESQLESAKVNLLPSPLSIGVLQEIGRRCSSKVELA